MRWTVEFDVRLAAHENDLLRRQLERRHASYAHSLIDRVGNKIIPIPGYHRNQDYEISLLNDDPDAVQIVASALSRQAVKSADFERSIYNFFHTCARSILQFSQAFYEIEYDPPVIARDRVVPFHIVGVVPGTVVRSHTVWVQRLPRTVARDQKLPHLLALNQERILRFGPPPELDGRIDSMMDSLVVLSQIAGAQFLQRNLQDPNNAIPIDFNEFLDTERRALAAATRLIGWTPGLSLLSKNTTTELYWWYRELRFERFLAELRIAILQELNRGLQGVAQRLGVELVIMIEGLPSVEEIDRLSCHLLNGDWSIERIQQALRY